MRGKSSRTTKSLQIELKLIGRINFLRLKILHFDIVQNVHVFNIFFSQKLFDMSYVTGGTFRALS